MAGTGDGGELTMEETCRPAGGFGEEVMPLYRACGIGGRDGPDRQLARGMVRRPPQQPMGDPAAAGEIAEAGRLGKRDKKARWSERCLLGSSLSTRFAWCIDGVANGEDDAAVDRARPDAEWWRQPQRVHVGTTRASREDWLGRRPRHDAGSRERRVRTEQSADGVDWGEGAVEWATGRW
jgi:hypothetical protein